jgi:hypothetical protein
MSIYLDLALKQFDWDVARILISHHIGLHERYRLGSYEVTSLHVAVYRCAPLDIIESLIRAGVDVNDGAPIEDTENYHVLELLLRNGADPNKACHFLFHHKLSVDMRIKCGVLLLQYGSRNIKRDLRCVREILECRIWYGDISVNEHQLAYDMLMGVQVMIALVSPKRVGCSLSGDLWRMLRPFLY